jgi:RND family efflux transporter MFP subunit
MKKRILASLAAFLFLAAAAWHFVKPQNNSDAKSAQSPASPVSTIAARRMDVPVRLEANGYVSSLNSVDVRPQVSNLIAKVHIKEGQFVKAGDILFTLDDRADRVNLQKAEAQMEKDQATLADAERQLARSRELLAKGFIAQSALDTVQTQVEAARATVRADKAAVAAARVALDYDTIRAPSSGRAGAIPVVAGSLVQPNAATPLVTIAQLDPIAVTFTLPEAELGALLAAQKNGAVKVNAKIPNAPAPLEGRVSFIDNAVDPQNGTIKVKATFPNAEHLLWPGQYQTVSTIVRELKDAIVIPQAAIVTGIDARTVYVAGSDNVAQSRPVELVYAFGAQAAVKGVREDERIVVDGKQNLRSGSRVVEASAGKGTEKNDGASKSKS